jgi:hypothetical protein
MAYAPISLSSGSVYASLEILLESCISVARVLLWSGVLGGPLAVALGQRHRNTLLVLEASSATLTGSGADTLSESRHLIQNHASHLTNILNNLEVEVEGGGAIRFV